jgi:hypothetical protein
MRYKFAPLGRPEEVPKAYGGTMPLNLSILQLPWFEHFFKSFSGPALRLHTESRALQQDFLVSDPSSRF